MHGALGTGTTFDCGAAGKGGNNGHNPSGPRDVGTALDTGEFRSVLFSTLAEGAKMRKKDTRPRDPAEIIFGLRAGDTINLAMVGLACFIILFFVLGGCFVLGWISDFKRVQTPSVVPAQLTPQQQQQLAQQQLAQQQYALQEQYAMQQYALQQQYAYHQQALQQQQQFSQQQTYVATQPAAPAYGAGAPQTGYAPVQQQPYVYGHGIAPRSAPVQTVPPVYAGGRPRDSRY